MPPTPGQGAAADGAIAPEAIDNPKIRRLALYNGNVSAIVQKVESAGRYGIGRPKDLQEQQGAQLERLAQVIRLDPAGWN